MSESMLRADGLGGEGAPVAPLVGPGVGPSLLLPRGSDPAHGIPWRPMGPNKSYNKLQNFHKSFQKIFQIIKRQI